MTDVHDVIGRAQRVPRLVAFTELKRRTRSKAIHSFLGGIAKGAAGQRR